jgi:uncharacterized membrane protein
MTYFIWLLRIVHIGAGVFWVGGVLMMAFFIAPAIQALGETGQKFAAHLTNTMKLNTRMSIASGLTAFAGIALYWIDSDGFQSVAWMMSGAGAGFGIGTIFGIIGFIYGNLIGSTTRAMMKLGVEMQGKPSPDQLTRMQALQKRQGMATHVTAYSLLLSVIFMSIARYFIF